MNLQLSLKKKWFEMTKSGVKTEDYREINQYWLRRLYGDNLYSTITNEKVSDEILYDVIYQNLDILIGKPKKFETNTMTLGYPKKGDQERTLILEHKGIEIRTGNPDWGAEPEKLYFVVKHGEILNK